MQKEYYTYEQLKEDMKYISEKLKPYDFQLIIPITRGGLVPACYLGYLLNIKNFQVLCLNSYENYKQNNLKVISIPKINSEIPKEKILVVDSIVDKGATLIKAREILGKEIKFFTIHLKLNAKEMPDFYLYTTQNWIVYPWEYDE